MYNLILEDMEVRTPHNIFDMTKNRVYIDHDWEYVRSFEEFVNKITENGLPNMISFDHDLRDYHYGISQEKIKAKNYDGEKTGYDAVKWLGEYCIEHNLEMPTCYVHSQNPAGADNIKAHIAFIKSARERGLI